MCTWVLRESLLRAYHDNNAHIGRERLYETLKAKYYFPQMNTSVQEYVTTCKVCQETKTPPHRRKAPLSPLPIVPPFDRIHLDHIGPLPKTKKGHRHLLVCVDSTTLFCEETADLLYREIICRYGAVKSILSDQGTAFRNKLMSELCKVMNIKQMHTSPMHAAGNAKVERANRTIMTSLKLICTEQDDWDDYIAPVLLSYRASVAVPLGMSPFQALFGRPMNLGVDLTLLQERDSSSSFSAYVADLMTKLKFTHEVVQKNMQDSSVRCKEFYDRTTAISEISVRSKDLLRNDAVKVRQSSKFHKSWSGPF